MAYLSILLLWERGSGRNNAKRGAILKYLTNKGFALIELLISLVILAIIVVPLTTLLTSSFSGVFSAGDRSTSQYKAQDAMENSISGNSVSYPDTNITTNTIDNFIITFDGTPLTLSVEEVNVSVYYTDSYGNDRETTLKSFVP